MGALALIPAGRFRLLAHTADIGLEVKAPTREALFVTAAEGFKALLFGASPAAEAVCREIRLEAPDLAALLVAWLNEILCQCELAKLVPAAFRIGHLDEQRLTATLTGEPFDPARHAVERTAKAVTYHRLVVEERDAGWYARVYIDL